jgi:hypothetical protein
MYLDFQGKDGDKMNKNITLIGSCLLLFSTQAFADRPAMEDSAPASRPSAPAPVQEPEPAPVSAVDLSIQQEQAPAVQLTGDTLELHPGETLPVNVLDFPRRGMSMEKVQNELGIANEVSDAIGEPPITTWTYSDRVVYFEHDHVVHVVAN